ncbi:MAG TPA: 1,4-alpha-glucan branching protein domain-containing protein [Chloroflexia bacterium]|nr:1,4-alpha-glucan branching protein domain-containing protein [Chloroflexia bacterium]
MPDGGFTFVLHSHMPFYRGAGKWPHGEENLHEVMAETYVPLLEALTDLHEAGVRARVTLGITPVLAEQLADALITRDFEAYLEQEILSASEDVKRFEQGGDQHFLYLAHFYLDWYLHILEIFRTRFNRDIVGGFRRLQDAGVVEILTSAATHAYLPLMQRDSTLRAQLAIGKRSTERHFGRTPRAIWLPECAYRPAYYAMTPEGGQYTRPGLETWLDEANLRLFFSESSAVEGSRVLGRAERETREVAAAAEPQLVGGGSDIYGQAGQAIEQMGARQPGWVTEKRVVPFDGAGRTAVENGGTFEAYLVRDSDVAVLGRNRTIGEQVWAAAVGYPGDPVYREFHRKDPEHGFQYWRVTDNQADIAYKQPYEPYNAGKQVQMHADHFVSLVRENLAEHAKKHGEPGIIVAAYDTELFGHWWFEGVDWLKRVLTQLAETPGVELTTASDWLEAHPADKVIDLPESSWGHAGTHITWINPETTWMWAAVHAAESRMEGLVDRHPNAEGSALAALNQAARELVLLQASDWEFLYTTGQARQYAGDRFSEHVERFNDLSAALEGQADDDTLAQLAARYAERDNLFPDIDYRLFAATQP